MMKIVKILLIILSLLIIYACNEELPKGNENSTLIKTDLQPVEEFGTVQDIDPPSGWWDKVKKWVEDHVTWGHPANNCPQGFGVCFWFDVTAAPGTLILTPNDSLENKGVVELTIEDDFACLLLKQNVPSTSDSILTINEDFDLGSNICNEFEYEEIILPKGQYKVKYDTTKFDYPFVFIHAITTELTN